MGLPWKWGRGRGGSGLTVARRVAGLCCGCWLRGEAWCGAGTSVCQAQRRRLHEGGRKGGTVALLLQLPPAPPPHHAPLISPAAAVVLFLWYHMLFCRDLVLLFVVLVVLQKPRIWSGRVLSVFWTSHWIPGDSRQFLCIKSTCIRGHMSMLWV